MSNEDWEKLGYEEKLVAFKKIMKAWNDGEIDDEPYSQFYKQAEGDSPALERDFLFIEQAYTPGAGLLSPSDKLWNDYKKGRIQDREVNHYLEEYEQGLPNSHPRKTG